MEEDLTLGSEHTIQYTDDVLQNCSPETYITILTNVTPTNLTFLKDIIEHVDNASKMNPDLVQMFGLILSGVSIRFKMHCFPQYLELCLDWFHTKGMVGAGGGGGSGQM